MKTRILTLLVLIAITVVSCQKDEKQILPQDVSFGIDQVDQTGLKADTILCPTDEQGNLLSPTVAEIEVKDLGGALIGTFYPEIFVLNNKLYTQAIKLVPGSYKVTKFVLWTKNPVDFPPPDAKIVMATPNLGAAFAEYINPLYLLDYEFTVDAFAKKEIKIEVLCFEPAKYTEFGFFWFQVDEIVIREKCFFGDLCVKNPDEYTGSNYALQPSGLQIDMPAIFKIHAYKGSVAPANELPNSPFSNNVAPSYGVGAPVCVKWPDRIRVPNEEFIFELWIYVAVGGGFDWVLFHTWTFVDDALLTAGGADGVVDFVLGNCNYTSTDLQLAPYMNLPQTASINIQHNANGTPWYWDLTINSVAPAGTYDIPSSGFMAGWCGDADEVIGTGSHTFSVYSSLVPASWPTGMPAYITAAKLNSVNWLFNNLGSYGIIISGMYIDPLDNLSVSEGHAMQNAIWRIINGNAGPTFFNEPPGLSSLAMATAALPNTTFTPLPGGWASIILVPHVNGVPDATKAQLIMTVVDP
jgi:hypothetical protein